MKKSDRKRVDELCALLPTLRQELFALGMLKTGHALDSACKQIGYELAEKLQPTAKARP